MAQCLKCGAEAAEHRFRVLEVQTLPIRDITGEKRVQALGLFQDWAICGRCAEERVTVAQAPGGRLVKRCLPFGVLLVVGIVLTALVRSDVMALTVLGPAAIFCGLVGGVSAFRKEQAQNQVLRDLPREEALRQAAWSCLLEAAPKKDSDNDLTYIPVDARTRAMEPKELLEAYDLLPAIALKARDMLQEETV